MIPRLGFFFKGPHVLIVLVLRLLQQTLCWGARPLLYIYYVLSIYVACHHYVLLCLGLRAANYLVGEEAAEVKHFLVWIPSPSFAPSYRLFFHVVQTIAKSNAART